MGKIKGWRAKIKEGYAYSVGDETGGLVLYTGCGGAILYGERCEEMGVPDIEIQKSIKVHLSQGAVSLDRVEWYKIITGTDLYEMKGKPCVDKETGLLGLIMEVYDEDTCEVIFEHVEGAKIYYDAKNELTFVETDKD